MKKILFCISFIFLSCAVTTVFSETTHCLQWKKICIHKKSCLYRDATRHSCFRCVKPNHYGFHLHPNQIHRETCSLTTVHYLQTMGYRCYQPRDAQICKQWKTIKQCHCGTGTK